MAVYSIHYDSFYIMSNFESLHDAFSCYSLFKSALIPDSITDWSWFIQALADMLNPCSGCNTAITGLRIAGNALGAQGVVPLAVSQVSSGMFLFMHIIFGISNLYCSQPPWFRTFQSFYLRKCFFSPRANLAAILTTWWLVISRAINKARSLWQCMRSWRCYGNRRRHQSRRQSFGLGPIA